MKCQIYRKYIYSSVNKTFLTGQWLKLAMCGVQHQKTSKVRDLARQTSRQLLRVAIASKFMWALFKSHFSWCFHCGVYYLLHIGNYHHPWTGIPFWTDKFNGMTGEFAECSCAEENHELLSWLPSGKLAELWTIPDLYVDEFPITTSTYRGFSSLPCLTTGG